MELMSRNPMKMSNRRRFGFIYNWYRHVREFLLTYFEKSGIHGFFYFVYPMLTRLERIFWLILIVISFYFCATISLQSFERFETKSTVVTIEKDHYYWNTTLPSLTICPAGARINKELFNEYCSERGITGQDKTDFYEFTELLANATYDNFSNLKYINSIAKLNIKPKDYMMLIYNLTEDWSRRSGGDNKVRAIKNLEFVRTEQIITERGICYTANSYLATNLSTSMLLFNKPPPTKDPFYRNLKVHEVIYGNLFDGDTGYNFVGFEDMITMYVHSPLDTIDISKRSYTSNYPLEFNCYAYETIADNDFEKNTRVKQRGCRFITESNLTHFDIYTRGLCLQECRLNLVYHMCKCIPHFYPVRDGKKVCSYSVLRECVGPKKNNFIQLLNERNEKFECNCLQNCVSSNVFIDLFQALEGSTDLLGTIGGLMVMKQYPMIRYKRKILFSFIDLLVSVGGTAGLFLGFCVLGAIEIPYFFTLRLFWYIKFKRDAARKALLHKEPLKPEE